jgi:glycosyltransferase involved in cell wall biosynthesis
MKPLILSTYDIQGGAARASYRLHQGFRQIGLESQMLVQYRTSDDRTVLGSQTKLDKTIAFLRPGLDGLPLGYYRQRKRDRYSLQWLPDGVAKQVQRILPDVVNLHWTGSGFVNIATLPRISKQLKIPLVLTLHDMWAFTGGCHYSDGCDRYHQACGQCPALASHRAADLSRWVWQRKRNLWQNLDLTIVTPSQWLANCARASSLLQQARIEVIPYGLDLQRYCPQPKDWVRKLLRLPLEKPLILFGAADATSDRRKGFHLLEAALRSLRSVEWEVEPELVIFGASRPVNPPDFGFRSHYLGTLQDDLSLAIVYASADVFVAPSVQDNLPNTVLEALACGVPCVAFQVGGMPDLIDHERTGYLAKPFEVEELARGMVWALQHGTVLAPQARAKAERDYGLTLQADRYRSLFEQLHSDDR